MDTLVALGMWLVMRMRRIVICGLLGFITYSKLFLKRYDFREKLLYVMCVFWFSVQLLSETFLILRRNE